jgi:two-component system chemotaxis sensor kinase CheA
VLDANRKTTDKRILVVEDSETTRTLQEILLTEAGYSVLVAADGQAAWEQLQDGRIDLVITDVSMPRMDGFALIQAIRSAPGLRSLPVVMLSGAYSEEEHTRSQQAGANAYLDKATAADGDLITAVRRLLRAGE